jgi:hypothetical protein
MSRDCTPQLKPFARLTSSAFRPQTVSFNHHHGTDRRLFVLSCLGFGYNVGAMDICGGLKREKTLPADACTR